MPHWIAFLAVLLWFATPVVASAQDTGGSVVEERAQARVFEALDFMDEGAYGEARLLIKVALELNPALDRAWYYLAQCDAEIGKKQEAIEALDVYEGRDLTEYERTQVATLRKRLVQLPDETSAADEDGPGAGTGGDGASQAPESAAAEGQAEPVASEPSPEEATSAPAAEAAPSTSSNGATTAAATTAPPGPGPGPVLLAAGGVVAGIGIGFVAGGLSMSAEIDTWETGQGLYYAGLGMAVGGGLSVGVGIPVTVLGKRKATTVALSWTVQPDLGATSLLVGGRW